MVRVASVEVLEAYRVRLGFTDGTSKVVDLAIYLHGPIFDPIRADPAVFRAVRVDSQLGTIVWDNGADIDPDVLYLGLKPAWMESEQPAR
jgi:hypothetical protein